VSESAIEKARLGIYIENIALDVSPERLRRFFVKQEKSYQVTKSIRDSCIFARQDVTRDPPFSKLDLISFRNVMIYLEPPLQRRLIPMFHYALKPGGVLVLGTSETIGGASDLFSALDKKNKVYGKLASAGRLTVDFAAGHRSAERASAVKVPEGTELGRSDAVQKEADRLVMARFAPPGVVINGDMQIIQFRGHTGAFLEPAPGEASLNITKMARDGLALELRAAIHRARRSGAAVRAEGVQIRHDGGVREVAIEVLPLPDALGEAEREPYFLVLFEEVKAQRGGSASPGRKGAVPSAAATKRVAVLEAELASTKDYLQAIIEEQEATNEELQSANEEILSSNEELQSINEELETAKEELQSTNEELTTLNEELGNRNVELTQLNDDLENLFISVNIPIVMLSRDLRIRRFTPMAQKVLNLIPGDVGRSLSDIRSRIDVPDMEQLIADVIDTMSIREREVQDREGHWYSMRIRPYRTTDNKIEGAVICFVDVDMLHRTVEELRKPT
jgi:two-component system CheB/CheR fusion protein